MQLQILPYAKSVVLLLVASEANFSNKVGLQSISSKHYNVNECFTICST